MNLNSDGGTVRTGVQRRSAKRLESNLALFAIDCPREGRVTGELLASTESEEHVGSLGGDLRCGEGAVDDDEIRDIGLYCFNDLFGGRVAEEDVGALELEVGLDVLKVPDDILDLVKHWRKLDVKKGTINMLQVMRILLTMPNSNGYNVTTNGPISKVLEPW